MSHGWAQNNAPAFEQAFFTQIEREASLPTTTAVLDPTKVMILDTSPDGPFPEPHAGPNEHGLVMGEIVRKLGCPTITAGCNAIVSTRLALSLEYDQASQTQTPQTGGGQIGQMTDAAVAIANAVDFALGEPGSDNVILNLSWGWDGYWGGVITGSWQSLDPPARAIYSAIAYASCKGAITIAAAGNRPGGPVLTNGAAYPAAWETEPAPDGPRCAAFNLTPASAAGAYRPFLHAIGAVDGVDRPLVIERPNSRPRLVSPGDHVSMTRNSPVDHSSAYTGTSVSAAGTSAAAAILWTYLPHLAGHEIMDIVYNTGVALPLTVDLCHGPTCAPNPRRISICRVTREACTRRGDCSSVPVCGTPNPGRNASVRNLNFTVPVPALGTHPATASYVPLGSPCNVLMHTTGTPPRTVPKSAVFLELRRAPPRIPPVVIACPGCGLFKNKDVPDQPRLLVGISSEGPAMLEFPVLRGYDVHGNEMLVDLYASIPFGDLRGMQFEVEDLPIELEESAGATIEFLVDGEHSNIDVLSVFE